MGIGDVIKSNIIFSIGQTGAAQFKADMLIVAGAIAAVGKVVIDGLKAADEFSDKMAGISTESRKLALEMDRTAHGLINTADTFDIMAKMEVAGIKVTREFAQAFGTTVADAAKKHGESLEKATARAHHLADSISKGNSRALKEYGIELKDGATLQDKVADGMAQITERAKGMKVEITDLGQQWDALSNGLGTARGYMFDLLGDIPIVGNVVGGMTDNLTRANTAFEDMKTFLEGTDFNVFDLAVARWNDRLSGLLHTLPFVGDKIASAFGLDKGVTGLMEQAGAQKDGELLADWFAGNEPGAESNIEGWTPSASDIAAAEEADKKRAARIEANRGRGGGGGRKRGPAIDEMVFTSEEVALAEINDLLDSANVKRERSLELVAQMADFENILAGYAGEEVEAQLTNEQVWAAELDHEREVAAYEEARHRWRMQAMGIEEVRRVSSFERMLGIEQSMLTQSRDMWVSGLQGKMQMLSGLMSGWAGLMESGNRRAFAAGKAAAVAQALMDTIAGSVAAYRAWSGVPVVGKFLGAAAAAGVVAWGMIRVNQIRNIEFKDGGKVSGMPSLGGGGGGSIGSSTGASAMSGSGGGGDQPINVNVTVPLDGEVIYENQQKHNWAAARNGRPNFGWAAA